MTWSTCCISYCILLAMFLIFLSFCINVSAKWMQTIQPFAVFFCWRTMDITKCLVSDSDVTPTDRWLNVWCIWHTYLETLQECWSRRRIGWIIQDFRETCVSRSLTLRLETKLLWRQNPSRKKKAIVFTNVTTSAYQGQLNAGFLKVCDIFKVRGTESLTFILEFHTPVCYCGDISTPRNVTLNETNCDWLFDMSVKRPHGRALANEHGHLFQTFSRQSEGLATRDY